MRATTDASAPMPESEPDAAAVEWAGAALERDCRAGIGDACSSLGRMYAAGHGVAADGIKSVEFFELACDAGSCAELKRLAAGLEARCATGSGGDCNSAAAFYARGVGEGPQANKALRLRRSACDKGYAFGCAMWGSDLKKGSGAPADPMKAAAAYQRGCDLGSPFACAQLGSMLHRGEGVPTNPRRAAHLYERGCNLPTELERPGRASSCLELGMMYHEGIGGLLQDDRKAARFFQLACDDEHEVGCYNLANAYATGQGVRLDYARATALFRRGCESGHEASCDASRRLRGGP
jgi:TPR repeat protein